MRHCNLPLLAALVLAGSGFALPVEPQEPQPPRQSLLDGVYSAAQAGSGQAVYRAKCSLCHRDSLAGGVNESPALVGDRFLSDWTGMPLRSLYGRILSTMPQNDPGSLEPEEVLELVAFLLRENGYPPSHGHSLSIDELAAIQVTLPR